MPNTKPIAFVEVRSMMVGKGDHPSHNAYVAIQIVPHRKRKLAELLPRAAEARGITIIRIGEGRRSLGTPTKRFQAIIDQAEAIAARVNQAAYDLGEAKRVVKRAQHQARKERQAAANGE